MKKNNLFLILIIPFIFILFGFHFLNTTKSNSKNNKNNKREINYNNELKDQEINYLTPERISPTIEAFFSPDEDIKGKIIEYIRKENKAIWCAAFRLTDKEITSELIEAHKRGIHLVFVIDKEGLSSIFSKLLHILKNGITIFVYPPINDAELYNTKNKSNKLKNSNLINFSTKGIMHNKFFIFHGLKTIITGSFNFTVSAQKINQENILIIQNHPIFNKYFEQFKKLCERSTKL